MYRDVESPSLRTNYHLLFPFKEKWLRARNVITLLSFYLTCSSMEDFIVFATVRVSRVRGLQRCTRLEIVRILTSVADTVDKIRRTVGRFIYLGLSVVGPGGSGA